MFSCFVSFCFSCFFRYVEKNCLQSSTVKLKIKKIWKKQKYFFALLSRTSQENVIADVLSDSKSMLSRAQDLIYLFLLRNSFSSSHSLVDSLLAKRN